ncbi:MAG: cell wall-binding repeat-containing protein [Ornithinimicrobium sp.]|uniref:cell wall-binding repeat-containing protein n=1 Tax=Ornithinimicrobium sp. TaxID=1977084 RepID=UPI003D9ADBCF
MLLVLALAGGLGWGTSSAASPQAPPPAQSTAGDVDFHLERLAGSSRYGTAAAVSRRFFAAGKPVVFVVTGADFPDGLAAGPAGARLNGPVLFTGRDSVPGVTQTELRRLRPGRIVVVGGSSAVSEAVRRDLGAFTAGTVTRISGADRYATAAALSRTTHPRGSKVVYVSTGADFPDALSGGAAAGIQNAPMLLTGATSLPPSTRTELERLHPERIMVIGGPGAVSASVATQLDGIATTERVWGRTRYTTALAVSRRVFGTDRPAAVLATGRDWPDALASGPVVRVTHGPVLLSAGTGLTDGVPAELVRITPRTAYLLGGERAQTDDVARQVQRRLGVCWAGTRPTTGSEQVFDSVPGAGRKVAFTLDMGGRLDPARSIVQYLVDHQVCTTFFPTAAMAVTTEGRKVMAAIAAHPELFELGNHTVHHCDLVSGGGGSPSSGPCRVRMTSTFIRTELRDAERTLEGLTGMPTNPYWRPPYGSHNSFVREVAASVGYTKTVMWNRDTIDWDPATTTNQIVSRVVSPLPSNGTIVLSHLGGYHTRDALPQIVNTLRAGGYTLTTVSDLRDG